jgi:1-acyl-sn-glycerol-3-phosphate acyltransferase
VLSPAWPTCCPTAPWERPVADAEIIPIGTRGRPGRGTGSPKPSSAARSLAAKPAPKPASKAAPKPAAKAAATKPRTATPRRTSKPVAAEAIEQVTTEAVPPSAPPRPAATTVDRGPLAGIARDLWLPMLQGAAREVWGEQWEPQLAQLLAVLRRRLTGDYEVDEFGFDPEVTEKLTLALLRPIAEKWFRVEVRGIENIPAEGGALIVSNHSGTVPLDALMTTVAVHDNTGRFLRLLGADLVFRMPFIGEMARRGGATLACNEDAERMLRRGDLVGVWPEGFKGIGKPFSQRYKLQRFGRGGFVSAALRTGVPIIPLSVVGAEETYPLVGNIPSLARLLGVPYIPVTPFFPWLGPLGLVPLPSKWLLEFGEPIRTDEIDAGAADDPMLVFHLTDQVRETIQQTLYNLLMARESVWR